METRRHERAGAASVWAAATLKQSVLILLPRTVTFETISSGTTHKERHGGKINHSAPPTEPFAAHCLRGLQKLIRENLRILAGAVLGWVWPRCPINSFQSGSSLNDPPPPHTPPTTPTHTRAPSMLALSFHIIQYQMFLINHWTLTSSRLSPTSQEMMHSAEVT